MQSQEKRILDCLTDTPISREALSRKTGIEDRTMREHIAVMRKKGVPICSKSDGKGYWLGNEKEIKITVNELRYRAFDMLRTAKAMEDGACKEANI